MNASGIVVLASALASTCTAQVNPRAACAPSIIYPVVVVEDPALGLSAVNRAVEDALRSIGYSKEGGKFLLGGRECYLQLEWSGRDLAVRLFVDGMSLDDATAASRSIQRALQEKLARLNGLRVLEELSLDEN